MQKRAGRPAATMHENPAFAALGFSNTIEERFWSRVVKDVCWVWTGYRKAGYGQIGRGGRGSRIILTHRLSWIFHFGPIPEGLKVLHKCDNPPCCNPDHLFLGTDKDNVRDKINKGRLKWGTTLGGANNKAKLTPEIVREIRRLHCPVSAPSRALAKRFAVSQHCIIQIINRRTWAHV
jgi:hypothetical protein